MSGFRLLDVVEASASAAAAQKLFDRLRLMTPEGGYAAELLNDTGAPTVKGTIVEASHTDYDSFEISDPTSDHPLGIVYDDGIPVGGLCRVVIFGKAKVLLKDSTASTTGNWVQTSDVAGRADATFAAPNPSTHWNEVGHCLETASGGTDVLVLCLLHFN